MVLMQNLLYSRPLLWRPSPRKLTAILNFLFGYKGSSTQRDRREVTSLILMKMLHLILISPQLLVTTTMFISTPVTVTTMTSSCQENTTSQVSPNLSTLTFWEKMLCQLPQLVWLKFTLLTVQSLVLTNQLWKSLLSITLPLTTETPKLFKFLDLTTLTTMPTLSVSDDAVNVGNIPTHYWPTAPLPQN